MAYKKEKITTKHDSMITDTTTSTISTKTELVSKLFSSKSSSNNTIKQNINYSFLDLVEVNQKIYKLSEKPRLSDSDYLIFKSQLLTITNIASELSEEEHLNKFKEELSNQENLFFLKEYDDTTSKKYKEFINKTKKSQKSFVTCAEYTKYKYLFDKGFYFIYDLFFKSSMNVFKFIISNLLKSTEIILKNYRFILTYISIYIKKLNEMSISLESLSFDSFKQMKNNNNESLVSKNLNITMLEKSFYFCKGNIFDLFKDIISKIKNIIAEYNRNEAVQQQYIMFLKINQTIELLDNSHNKFLFKLDSLEQTFSNINIKQENISNFIETSHVDNMYNDTFKSLMANTGNYSDNEADNFKDYSDSNIYDRDDETTSIIKHNKEFVEKDYYNNIEDVDCYNYNDNPVEETGCHNNYNTISIINNISNSNPPAYKKPFIKKRLPPNNISKKKNI